MAASRSTSRDLAMIAVFAGVTAALGLVPPLYVPGVPAPISAQSLGVILAGAVLGARRGALSQLLFLALVALGLPLLAGGRGGLGVFMGMSVGFLLGWAPAAWLVGFLTERFGAPYRLLTGIVANALGGIMLLYAFGIAGFVARAHMSLGKAITANAVYLIGDSIKVVLAALIAQGVHRAYPGLLRDRA